MGLAVSRPRQIGRSSEKPAPKVVQRATQISDLACVEAHVRFAEADTRPDRAGNARPFVGLLPVPDHPAPFTEERRVGAFRAERWDRERRDPEGLMDLHHMADGVRGLDRVVRPHHEDIPVEVVQRGQSGQDSVPIAEPILLHDVSDGVPVLRHDLTSLNRPADLLEGTGTGHDDHEVRVGGHISEAQEKDLIAEKQAMFASVSPDRVRDPRAVSGSRKDERDRTGAGDREDLLGKLHRFDERLRSEPVRPAGPHESEEPKALCSHIPWGHRLLLHAPQAAQDARRMGIPRRRRKKAGRRDRAIHDDARGEVGLSARDVPEKLRSMPFVVARLNRTPDLLDLLRWYQREDVSRDPRAGKTCAYGPRVERDIHDRVERGAAGPV